MSRGKVALIAFVGFFTGVDFHMPLQVFFAIKCIITAPCKTFGEQREIYEWIGLFRGALFFLQGGAFFYSGGHFLDLEKSTTKFMGA